MRNLLGLFLVVLLLAFCMAEEDPPTEKEDRGKPKGCKRMNDWRKKPKFYKKGKLYFKDCKTYTCTEPKPRKFVWVDELDTKRCCSFNQTFYPISSKILCEQLPDDCTTVCVECVRVEAKANLDLVVDDNCPERPPETKVITQVPHDIKSPGYPNPYTPKQDICWSWTPKCGNQAYLEFLDFDVLGHDAYITIKPPINGKSKFWGNSFNSENAPPKTIGFPCDTAVMICFHSGKIVNGHKGFSAEIIDKPCTDWISSPNYENDTKDYFTCDETPPQHGYGPDIHHCDVRSPSSNGQTLNLDFCQFDIHAPLEGDYLTIHPNPTSIPKYYGDNLKASEAPPKWTEYAGVRYLTVCFKTRQTVDYHKGYLAEIYETGVSTTIEPGSETWEYSSSYDYSYGY
eukprot:TRINITY_DN15016_c0_g1_i2.p1 TRINITY_DN15016_c0_g1~~TRINITY_DN15016_c0_g1_i2.p1  ORF type:complete len:399 (+),score=88.21 TRINITY_DN15016_c0_g1_i2:3-1199(+)